MTKQDIYQKEVTRKILELMKSGNLKQWIRPWKTTGRGLGNIPINAVSKREYNGMNILILWMASMSAGYSDNRWMTFNQVSELGGMVKKGQKGTTIFLFKPTEKKEETDGEEKTKKRLYMKTYNVFNIEQTTVKREIKVEEKNEPIVATECAASQFIKAIDHKVILGSDVASYSPSLDTIRMPDIKQFNREADYYSTYLHELTHWTGHVSRLKREGIAGFVENKNSTIYAFEELVAELGSAFLCAQHGVEGELQHAAYLKHWVALLEKDHRAIFKAANLAAKATAFLNEKSSAKMEAA